jgi:hypothetical protein
VEGVIFIGLQASGKSSFYKMIKKYIEKLKEAKFDVVGYYFKSGVKDSIKRNELRNGNEKIPLLGILNTYNKLQLPSFEEGFDKLYYVRLDNNAFVVEEWNNEI